MAACGHLFDDEFEPDRRNRPLVPTAADKTPAGSSGSHKRGVALPLLRGRTPNPALAPAAREDVSVEPRILPGRSTLPLLPLDQPPRRRHMFLNMLDGPDYQDACDAADRYADERELALYGERDGSTRAGWSDENRAA